MKDLQYEMKPLSFYNKLINPEFVGQSRVDPITRTYIMVFKDENGLMYGFECPL